MYPIWLVVSNLQPLAEGIFLTILTLSVVVLSSHGMLLQGLCLLAHASQDSSQLGTQQKERSLL